ncbi:MAG TPA: hypothetical protein VMK05_13420 [Burkholderiales bacterium]|nr:hypothetical protein [Burkholderiales bacterium]
MDFTMPKLPAETAPFCWGAVAGAALLAFVGFNSMGWMSGATADKIAKRQAETAVTAALAPVCAAQFRSAPDARGRLVLLEKTERWSRGDELVKAGFTTMPGSKEPDQNIASACAELLIPEKQ